jgi:hypothetical protein
MSYSHRNCSNMLSINDYRMRIDILDFLYLTISDDFLDNKFSCDKKIFVRKIKNIDLGRALLRSMEYNLKKILIKDGKEIKIQYLKAKTIFEKSKSLTFTKPNQWFEFCNLLDIPSNIFEEFLPRLYQGDFEFERMCNRFILR